MIDENDNANTVKSRKPRFQFGLPALFGVVTLLCFAFAYPRFVLLWAALLVSTIFALVASLGLVYYPVARAANRLRSKENDHSWPSKRD